MIRDRRQRRDGSPLSFGEITSILCAKLRDLLHPEEGYGGPWVREVWDDRLVYEYDGKTWQCAYTLAGTEVTLGSPIEVKVAFVPATDSASARRVRVDMLEPIHMDPARQDGVLATADPQTGFLHLDGRISRTGVQRYRDVEGNEWGELRTEDEVFSPAALDSFRHVVVTDDHPDDFVSVRNVRDLQAGSTGTEVTRDGDYVRTPIVVTSPATILAIRDGKTQLSCGYTVDMVQDAGELGGQSYAYRQTNIRGNHVAIVDVARGGPGCALIGRGDGSAISVTKSLPAPAPARTPAPRGDHRAPRADARPEGKTMDPKKLIANALELLKQGKVDAAQKLIGGQLLDALKKRADEEGGGASAKIQELIALLTAAQKSGQPLLMEAALSKVNEVVGGGASSAEPPKPAEPPPHPAPDSATPPAQDDANKLRARVDALEAERKRDADSFNARTDARVKLVRQAEGVVKDLKADGLSDDEIMRAVVLAVSPDLKAKLDANKDKPGYLLASYEAALELHAARDRHTNDVGITIHMANTADKDRTDEMVDAYLKCFERYDSAMRRKPKSAEIKARTDQARRLVRICDRIPHMDAFHADEKEGIWARQLTMETLTELFIIEHTELKWVNGLAVVTTNVHEGATEYAYQEIEHTGRAKIVAPDATDIPFVDLQGRNNILPIKTIACAFRFTTQDVRTAMKQGTFDIASEKATAAREGHDLELNELMRTGYPMAGLYGYTTVPGLIMHAAANGDWTNPTTTPAEITSDFSTAVNAMRSRTAGIENPDSVVFPLDQHTRLSTTQNSAASDITVLDFLKKAHPDIKNWEWEDGMKTAGTGGTPAALIYRKDAKKSRVVIPMMMRPTPVQQRGLTFEVTLESRYGGVMAQRPRSLEMLQGI